MTTQERIYSYFQHNHKLRVLFIFDPFGGLCDELEHEDWQAGFMYHEFNGKSWFNLKYHLEHDWYEKKVVLLFRQLEPLNSSALLQFPLADLLVANATYREDDYAEFMEQHGLPNTMEVQKYVSKHVADFRLKKFNDVLAPYFNRNDFTEDNINRGFISVYLGLKQVLNWDRIIARVVCLGKQEEEKKREKFFLQLQKNQDAYDALQNRLERITGQRYEINKTEKVRTVAEAIKYNCIMALISEDARDNYRRLKIKDQLTLGRFNQFVESIRNDRELCDPFNAAVAELARDIKEDEIIRIYGTDQPYAMMTDALCWPILRETLTLLPAEAGVATDRLQSLQQLLDDSSLTKLSVETVLNISRYYQKANSTGTMRLNTPNDYIKRYTEEFYLMDLYYRKTLESFYQIKAVDCPFYSIIAEQKKLVDIHYSQKQQMLNEEWVACLREFGGKYSCLSYPRQENFYQDVINPVTTKQVVIVSDAMRYEVAAELVQKLNEHKHNTSFSSQIAMMPTETKYCKLSLLPHKELKLEGSSMIVDGKVLKTNDQRTAHMSQYRAGATCIDYKKVTESSQDEMRELFKRPIVYVMHDKIDKEGHDQSAIEMTNACASSIEQLAALVHRIHMTFNVTDIYITSDHGFLFEDKAFEDKDKHQVNDADIEKKTRYYLTTSDTKQIGITKFKINEVSGMDAPDVYVAVANGTNRMMASGGYNFAHGGAALQEIITPLIHSKQVRKEVRQTVTVSFAGNTNLTLVSSMVKFALLQNEPADGTLRALDLKYGLYVNGTLTGRLEDWTMGSNSENFADRVKDFTIRLASIPGANDIIELRVYNAEDTLNPLLSRIVKNSMAGIFEELDF